ncbi:MAG TPA: hypothetical protein VEC39_08150 [Vicinamibacterales bacterium]|nr:hypothetical protein [Vicinamibacterales bacterium]
MTALTCLTVAILAVGAVVPHTNVAAQSPTAPSAAEAAAIRQFNDAVTKYLKLRRGLTGEIAGPKANSTSSQLTTASDNLAIAIQRARPDARPGTIFVAPANPVLKKRIRDAVVQGSLAATLADIDDERATILEPKIHLRLPAASQMATMPPALLAALPRLPKELEYRIIGHYLVLRDVDAAIVIDYMPAAVPR